MVVPDLWRACSSGCSPDREIFTVDFTSGQPTRDGFIQGYNAQIAVDAAHQIIVAQRLQSAPGDTAGLVPLVDAVRRVVGAKPREVSADAGFCAEANLQALKERRIRAYVAVGRARHATGTPTTERRPANSPLTRAMANTLAHAGRRSRYRLRKQVVEPVFGQIKQARGFRQFLLRGLTKVRAEWALLCTVHNLLKLANARA